MNKKGVEEKEEYKELDVITLYRIIWERRKFILLGTFITTLVALIITIILPPTYQSTGFLSLSEKIDILSEEQIKNEEGLSSNVLSVPEFKGYLPILTRSDLFVHFLKTDREFLLRDDRDLIMVKIMNEKNNDKHFSPVYAFSRKDSMELGQLKHGLDNYIVGVSIKFKGSIPDRVFFLVKKFGQFVRDVLLFEYIKKYVGSNRKNAHEALYLVENSILEDKFELQQLNKKKGDIEKILVNYPQSRNIESRQLVSIDNGGDFFLSPVSQIVGIESKIAHIRRELDQKERELKKASLQIKFFSRMNNQLLQNKKIGEMDLLKGMLLVKEDIFKHESLKDDIVKQVHNTIMNDHRIFYHLFLK